MVQSLANVSFPCKGHADVNSTRHNYLKVVPRQYKCAKTAFKMHLCERRSCPCWP